MTKDIMVVNKKGLHARPATVFAEVASKFDGDVTISNGKKRVTGKSLIALMSLAVPKDAFVSVTVEGEGSEDMMRKLEEILGKNYD